MAFGGWRRGEEELRGVFPSRIKSQNPGEKEKETQRDKEKEMLGVKRKAKNNLKIRKPVTRRVAPEGKAQNGPEK